MNCTYTAPPSTFRKEVLLHFLLITPDSSRSLLLSTDPPDFFITLPHRLSSLPGFTTPPTDHSSSSPIFLHPPQSFTSSLLFITSPPRHSSPSSRLLCITALPQPPHSSSSSLLITSFALFNTGAFKRTQKLCFLPSFLLSRWLPPLVCVCVLWFLKAL